MNNIVCFFIVVLVAISCGESSEDDSSSALQVADNITVAGTLSFESSIDDAKIELLVATEEGTEITKLSDSTVQSGKEGEFTTTFASAEVINSPVGALLIKATKTRETTALSEISIFDHHHDQYEDEDLVLWSYAYKFRDQLTINVNVFSSLAYDIAKVQGDLSLPGLKKGEALTKKIFQIEDELLTLGKEFQKTLDLVKAMNTFSETAHISSSKLIFLLAEDLSDETLDGKKGEEALVAGTEKVVFTDFVSLISNLIAKST